MFISYRKLLYGAAVDCLQVLAPFKYAVRPGSASPCHTALLKVGILVDILRFCGNGNVRRNLFQKCR